MTIEVGSTVKGTVVKIADYGAIVRLAEGQSGLIHISEIADVFVRDVRDYLSENDEVTVKVLRLSPKGRFELSLKQCDAKVLPKTQKEAAMAGGAARPVPQTFATRPLPPTKPLVTFEDRLSKFMKDSEQRQADLKRNMESKRGRRRI